jgi:hypothetical protein
VFLARRLAHSSVNVRHPAWFLFALFLSYDTVNTLSHFLGFFYLVFQGVVLLVFLSGSCQKRLICFQWQMD